MIAYNILSCQNAFFAEVEGKVSALFAKVKNFISQELDARPCRLAPNFQSLSNQPAVLVEGAFWGGFLVFGVYFAVESCRKLYMRCTVESTAHQAFEKIGEVIKTAFVDLLSLCSSAVYLTRWADTAKIISLGFFLPFVNYLCYGLSVAIHASELLAGGFEIGVEKEAILLEHRPPNRELHQKRLCHAMMRVVASVSMIAWASIGVGALMGFTVAPYFAPLFLTMHCVVGLSAWFYKAHIDRRAHLLN
jgi:hypothetical protein